MTLNPTRSPLETGTLDANHSNTKKGNGAGALRLNVPDT
jgi:hypothetical protein